MDFIDGRPYFTPGDTLDLGMSINEQQSKERNPKSALHKRGS